MSCQPLPWQHAEWDQLQARTRNHNLAHAFLLKGTPGIGKYWFAKAISSWLLCESPNARLACEKCKSCTMIRAGHHPDLLCVEPDESGKFIKVDQVRQLTEFAHKTAQQGGRRIIIINPAEAMNVNASNALLKCLEEPGAETLFLLVSHRSGDMLPTIRSRCQALNFKIPETSVGLDWLKKQLAARDEANALLDLALGAPLLALSMSEQDILDIRKKLVQSIEALFRGIETPVELAKKWQGENIILVLEWLTSWLEDVIRLAHMQDENNLRNKDQLKLIKYLSVKSQLLDVIQVRDWFTVQRQILLQGGNLNSQLLIEGSFCHYLKLVF